MPRLVAPGSGITIRDTRSGYMTFLTQQNANASIAGSSSKLIMKYAVRR